MVFFDKDGVDFSNIQYLERVDMEEEILFIGWEDVAMVEKVMMDDPAGIVINWEDLVMGND